jgi:hypothetical protein
VKNGNMGDKKALKRAIPMSDNPQGGSIADLILV